MTATEIQTKNIAAEEIQSGDTIFIGSYTDQPMRVTEVAPAGKTRIHVTIDSGIRFSYRRRERVTAAA